MAISPGDPAPDVTLLAEGDRPVELTDLCRQGPGPGPLVLIFLRHFG